MNEYKPVCILGLPVRIIDAAILGGLIFFLLLAAVFSGRLDNPLSFIGKSSLAGCLYIGSILWLTRLRTKTLRFLVRTASVQAWREFFLLAPVILSLYGSTVYGWFHYASDSIIGILTGFLVLAAGPTLVRGWNRRADSRIGSCR